MSFLSNCISISIYSSSNDDIDLAPILGRLFIELSYMFYTCLALSFLE